MAAFSLSMSAPIVGPPVRVGIPIFSMEKSPVVLKVETKLETMKIWGKNSSGELYDDLFWTDTFLSTDRLVRGVKRVNVEQIFFPITCHIISSPVSCKYF